MAWDPYSGGRSYGGYQRGHYNRGTRDMATGRGRSRRAAPARRGRSSVGRGRRRRGRGRGRRRGHSHAAPAAPPPQIDWEAEAQTRYAQFGWMFYIPDLKNVLLSSIREGWSELRLRAALQNTRWWQNTPAPIREWTQLKFSDPATANRERVVQFSQLKTMAHNYAIPVSDATLNHWVEGQNPELYEVWIKNAAKSRFPGLAAAIDKGQTVEQFAAPYREIAAQTLEISPDTVSFNDGRWMKALSQRTKDGQLAPMSLADWQAELKTNASYGYDYTNNARKDAAELSTQLLQRFGGAA